MSRFMTSPRPHFFFLQLPSKVWVRKWPAVYIEGREDYRHVYGKQLSEIISAGGETEISETAADAKNPAPNRIGFHALRVRSWLETILDCGPQVGKLPIPCIYSSFLFFFFFYFCFSFFFISFFNFFGDSHQTVK